MGTLYLVATPIGNLEDISIRALRILKEACLVAAEDTRHTRKLLERYEITPRLISYHEHNKITRLEDVLAALRVGDVALVSDAGTPGLNDPGYELVLAALAEGFEVSPIPGPSAPVAALVASGLPTDAFLFSGYLPRRGVERRHLLEELVSQPRTLIFLETPHRLIEALEDLLAVLGDRPLVAARELTKIHEEFLRGTVSSVLAHSRQEEPRGEYTLIVGGAPTGAVRWEQPAIVQALRSALEAGEAPKQLVDRIAAAGGWRKKDVYRLLVDLKGKA